MYQVVDFGVFALFIGFSVVIGIYHGIKARHVSSAHSKVHDYLTAGQTLPVLPVCLSLLTTFTSGITVLGNPTEIYQRGAATGVFNLAGVLGILVAGRFFVPVFYKLKFTSIYTYLEWRFGSIFLRQIGTCVFLFNTFMYMALVIFAPAIALSGATNLPLWPFIVGVGIVGTSYTALGGIKAVVWADTLQASFMLLGLIALIVKGTLDAGGLQQVIKSSEQTGRLTDAIFKFDPNPFQYSNFWAVLIGGIFQGIATFGLHQMSIQRYLSMSSLKKTNIVLSLTIPFYILVSLITLYLGLLLFEYFRGCDPLALNQIRKIDQLPIIFAFRVLGSIPGMPGLFLSAIFSATLSTLSSGLNSIVAVLWENLLKERYEADKNRSIKPDHLMKILVLLLGLLTTLMAFGCKLLGSIFFIFFATLGATNGPIAGLFILGLLFPKANRNGAIIGFFSSFILMVFISIFSIVVKPYNDYLLPMSIPNSTINPSCSVTNSTDLISEFYQNKSPSYHYGSDSFILSHVSQFNYITIGILTTVIVGLIISRIFRQDIDQKQQEIAFACTFQGLEEPLPTRSTEPVTQMELDEKKEVLLHQLSQTDVTSLNRIE